jgi:ABC-2 type transport system ATP-binding protein
VRKRPVVAGGPICQGQGMAATVEFERFRRVFGETVAVEGLDLRIARGTIYGLLGPNGSGKTTCIRAICGLLKPTAGEVRVLGADARAERARVRPQLGYMPQQAALYEDLTARENLEFFARGLSVADPRGRSGELLELVDLAHRADDQVYAFSGGMKQRVSLACALLHEPPLLLLDEPTAGVDPLLRRRMWATFEELRAGGVTVILSTNQLDEAVHCDRLAVLREGRLLAEEPPSALLDRGRTRVTLSGNGAVRTLELADYEHELPALLAAGGVDSVRIERDSLEDVMLRLVEEAGP